MPQYRIYYIGTDGHFSTAENIECGPAQDWPSTLRDAWPNYLGEELQKAVAEVRKITSGDAATAAEDALGRMFNRSAR